MPRWKPKILASSGPSLAEVLSRSCSISCRAPTRPQPTALLPMRTRLLLPVAATGLAAAALAPRPAAAAPGAELWPRWTAYDAKKKDHKLEEVIETVESSEMPLDSYTWTHEDARLSSEQREAVMSWARQTRTLFELGDRPE